MNRCLVLVGALVCFASATAADRLIESSRAASFVGQNVSVCGNVAGTKKFSKGTYLNLGASYPRQHITVVIWDSDEQGFTKKFGSLASLSGKKVCADGPVEMYKSALQVKVSDPNLLRVTN